MIRGLTKKSMIPTRSILTHTGRRTTGPSFIESINNATFPFSTTSAIDEDDNANLNKRNYRNRINSNCAIPGMGFVGRSNSLFYNHFDSSNMSAASVSFTQKRNLWGWGRSKKSPTDQPTETAFTDNADNTTGFGTTDVPPSQSEPTAVIEKTSTIQMSPEEAMAQFEKLSNVTNPTDTTSLTSPIATETILTTNEWVSSWWPQDKMIDFLVYVHDVSGLNYALTIGAVTFAFRSLMFPLFIDAQRNSARMAHLQPEFRVLKEKIDRLDPKDLHKKEQISKQVQQLFKKYNVNPIKSVGMLFVQFPVFISMFVGLRKMPEYFHDELSTGGILWFTDLTAPDPYYAMPVFSGLSLLAMMQLSKKNMISSSPEQGKMMLYFFQGMAFVVVPFAMYLPTCILCYWTVNNSFSIAQTAALNHPPLRKLFGIWDLPKPVPGVNTGGDKGMMDMIQDSISGKRKEGNEINLKQRIELHNAAVEERKNRKKFGVKK